MFHFFQKLTNFCCVDWMYQRTGSGIREGPATLLSGVCLVWVPGR